MGVAQTDYRSALLGASASVQALALALEVSPSAAAIISPSAFVEYANVPFAELVGCARERLVGSDLSALRQVLDDECHTARDSLGAGTAWRGEVAHVRPDGRRFWVATNISPLVDESGEIAHYLALSEDITKYKGADAGPDNSQNREGASPSCILLIGLDGTILFLAGSAKGIAEANLVGQDLLALTLDQERPRVRAYIDDVVRTRESVQFEVVGMAAGESTARYVTRMSPIVREGEVVALTLISHELPHRGPARGGSEGAPLMEETRSRLFTEASLEAIVLHGNGKVIDANPAFAELFGYERREVIGMPVQAFLTQESHENALERAAAGIEGRYYVSAVRRDGSTFPIEVYVRNLAHAEQHVHAAVIREMAQHAVPPATGDNGSVADDCGALSAREVEVLELLAQGLTNRQVAKRLRLSARTVDHHVSHILTKLNVPNRTAAVYVAEQAGVFGQDA